MSNELPPPPRTREWSDVRPWRVQMRQALIGARMSLDGELRRARGAEARQRLLASTDLREFRTLGIYWPVRGEIDVREVGVGHLQHGGRVGLPVVVTKSAPVEFWSWEPGMTMSKGIWNIPIPEQRTLVIPDALIVPLVGWDSQRYRLGYGGGYYDRTIAAATRRPYCIGLGYAEAALESIFPQLHDIPMDVIITEGPRLASP